jgi:hypothetical protein
MFPNCIDNNLGLLLFPRSVSLHHQKSQSRCIETRVYAVVTFLHKYVYKRLIRLDWKGQYTNSSMKYMLQGRMLWLWAPRHLEQPMLIVNNHQAGSGDSDLQQRVWLAMQAMRARYPDAQDMIGGD